MKLVLVVIFALALTVSSKSLQMQKRCGNFIDQGCSQGHFPDVGSEGEWVESGPGKRDLPYEYERQYAPSSVFKSLADFFNRMHLASSKRALGIQQSRISNGRATICASLYDNCNNPGAGIGDEESAIESGPGRR